MSFHHDIQQYLIEEKEVWMAGEGYAVSKEALLRKVAMRVILQLVAQLYLGAFIPYVAMNYFDRLISRHKLPKVLGLVRDDIVLAAHCCLMMAWKNRNFMSFSFSQFVQKRNLDKNYINQLPNMELEISKRIKWQTRAVTAITFLEFFVDKMPVGKDIRRKTLNEMIIQAQHDISFTRFRHSVIAAAALLTACRFLYEDQYDMNKQCLLANQYANYLEDLEDCLKKTYDMYTEKQVLLWPQLEVGAGEISQAGEISEAGEASEAAEATSSSSVSHRPGKEPMQDEPEIENDPEMRFELKWMLVSFEEPEELTIDSPLFRTPAPAYYLFEQEEPTDHLNCIPPFRTCNCNIL